MAIKKTVIIEVDTSKAVKSVDDLDKSVKKLDKSTDNVKNSSSGLSSNLDNITGGGISKIRSFTKGLGGVTKGFKSIRVAIAASGIGLLLIAILAIQKAFTSSEEGQNKFAKLMGVIGSVVGNVVDVIADLGEIIIGVLSGDSEAIKSATAFGNKIFDVVGLPIKNIITVVKTAANVIQGLWNDGIDGALSALDEGVEEVKGNFVDAGNAINDAKNALVEFGEEAIREAKIAAEIADQRAKADKIERGLITERAKADREIAKLRDIAARQDKFNSNERKAALLEASRINEDITEKEIKAAKIRRDTIIEENKLSKSTKEDLNAQAEAEAAVIRLETKRLNLQKRLGTEISSINNQNAAKAAQRRKEKETQDAKDVENERKRLDEISKIQNDFRKQNEDLDAQTEEDKLQLERDRAQNELDLLIGTETEKREAQLAINELFDQKEDDLKDQRQKERFQKDNELRAKELDDIQKARLKEQELDKIVQDNKKALISDGLATIQGLLKKGSAAGKGIAAAQTIFDTQQGITAALAAKGTDSLLPFPVRLANAALVGIKGSLALKNILSTDPATGAGGSADNNASSGGQQAPAFNLVGGSGVNQIQESIESEATPIQAFVVGSEVTSQQSLDRNLQDSATLG